MTVIIGKNKIKCEQVCIVFERVSMWNAIIPDKPFDFDVFDYNFCQHYDGMESVCVSVKVNFVDIVED